MSKMLGTKARIALVKKALKGLTDKDSLDILCAGAGLSADETDNDGQFIIYTGVYDEGCSEGCETDVEESEVTVGDSKPLKTYRFLWCHLELAPCKDCTELSKFINEVNAVNIEFGNFATKKEAQKVLIADAKRNGFTWDDHMSQFEEVK